MLTAAVLTRKACRNCYEQYSLFNNRDCYYLFKKGNAYDCWHQQDYTPMIYMQEVGLVITMQDV